MKIKLKVLTPVHIGSGEEITPIEYLIYQNKLIRLNMESLFKDDEFKPYLDQFVKEASLGNRYIGNIINPKLLVKHPLYSLSIHSNANSYLTTNQTNIKSFIKSAGKVYIPGSSLKGSILSGVMEGILEQKKIQKFKDYKEHLGDVLSEITGRVDMKEFACWLDVTDTDFKKPEDALEIYLAKLIGARTDREIPILYEALKENIDFVTELKSTCKITEGEILKLADRFYRKVYEKEKSFSLQILPQVSKNTFLLRIGQGSTAWSTSFLILAEELGIKEYSIKRPKFHRVSGSPRTRKLITGTKSMGWVEASYA